MYEYTYIHIARVITSVFFAFDYYLCALARSAVRDNTIRYNAHLHGFSPKTRINSTRVIIIVDSRSARIVNGSEISLLARSTRKR